MQMQRKAKGGITVKKSQSLGTIKYAHGRDIGELIKLMDYQRKAGIPGWHSGEECACQCRRHVSSLGWEDALEKEWQPTPVFLPRKLHKQGSLTGNGPWGHKRVRHDWAHTHAPKENSPCFTLTLMSFWAGPLVQIQLLSTGRQMVPKFLSPTLSSPLASSVPSLVAWNTILWGYSVNTSHLTSTKHYLLDPNSQPHRLKTSPWLETLHFLESMLKHSENSLFQHLSYLCVLSLHGPCPSLAPPSCIDWTCLLTGISPSISFSVIHCEHLCLKNSS